MNVHILIDNLYDLILKEISNSDYKKVYNIVKNRYENVYDTEVLDSYKVVFSALINAVSIAGMLLTTTSLIINEYQNNYNNNYGEI